MPKVSQEKLDEIRLKILHAALRCFGRKGIKATTMRDICAEVGMSAGAIYHHFSGKDEIITSISEFGRDENTILFNFPADVTDPLEKILLVTDRVYDAYTGNLYRDAVAANLHFLSEALVNPAFMSLMKKSYDQVLVAITKILKDARAQRRMPKDINIDSFAELIVSIQLGFQTEMALNPTINVEQYKQTLKTLLRTVLSKQ